MNLIQKERSTRHIREFRRVANQLEPELAARFLVAVESLKTSDELNRLLVAIKSNNQSEIENLIGDIKLGDRLQGAGLKPGQKTVQATIVESFQQGAVAGAFALPEKAGRAVSTNFVNPESLKYLQTHLPTLITNVNVDQQNAIRNAVYRGFEEGRPAPLIAREVRGVIGLTENQTANVLNFRRQLEAGRVMGMTAPWERRLDAVARNQARSIFNSGAAVPKRVNALVEKYERSLLNLRSKTIARTEIHTASIEGQREIWDQARQRGLIDETARRIWIVTPDERLRANHAAVPRMNPDGVPLDTPFETPIGPVMSPGNSGVASFDINCRCAEGLVFED